MKLPLSNINFFFERTIQDSARFIDIAEKYKVTVLESHSQKKEKENRTHPVGLGRQPEKHNSTHPVGLGNQHGKLIHSKRRDTQDYHGNTNLFVDNQHP